MRSVTNPREPAPAGQGRAARLMLSLIVGCAPAAGIGLPTAVVAEPDQTPRQRVSSALGACALDDNELILFQKLIEHSKNPHDLSCDPTLQTFAEFRARDMATRGYLSHISPEHRGPNQMLRDASYPLPDIYRDGLANNVESIVGGIESPDAVWKALLASPAHRAHLLGEGAGFDEQDELGVAYARNLYAPHVDYWVIVIARRARPDDPRVICTPPPATCFPVGPEAESGDPAR